MKFILLALILFTNNVFGQIYHHEKVADARRFLINYSKFGYSGNVLLADNGKVILEVGIGMGDDSLKTLLNSQSIFDIGSLAKQFTAAAVLKLEWEGKLSTSSPIDTFFSHTPPDKKNITIEQLLNHTAGLDTDFPFSNETGEYYEPVGKKEALRRILEMPLIQAPGTGFSYSNMGYVLAAAIVERVAGMSFQDYLERTFIRPMGLLSTGFWGKRLPDQPRSRLVKSYDERGRVAYSYNYSDTLWFDLGGGSMVSSTRDLYSWAKALNNGKVLPKDAFNKILHVNKGYSYGWEVSRDSTLHITNLYHGGNYLNYGSYLGFFPGTQTYLVHLYNRSYQDMGAGHLVNLVVPKLLKGEMVHRLLQQDSAQLPLASSENFSVPGPMLTKYLLTPSDTLILSFDKNLKQYFIRGIGQGAIDFITRPTGAQQKVREDLNQTAVELLRDVQKGNNTKLLPLLRHSNLETSYFNGLRRVIETVTKERGGVDTIYSLGTVPIALPVGAHHTVLVVKKETYAYMFGITWLNKKIMNTRGYQPRLFSTRFNQTVDGYLAWSPIWLKNLPFKLMIEEGVPVLSDGSRKAKAITDSKNEK